MAAPPAFIQLSGGQGQISAPPHQHYSGNFGGHQGYQGHNGQQAHQGQPMLQRQVNPTPPPPPPPPPMGQMPQGGNQVRGGMPPAMSSHALPYGATPPQNQMIRQPHGQRQLSHPSHLPPRMNIPQPDMPRRQKVEVFDIHSECLTEADARERLSSHVVICMTKADTTNGVDQDGYLLPPTWDRTTHSEQTDISQQEATRKVRELERTTLPVSDKKQDLPAALQRQFEHAQDRLERQEPDPRFHYVLAQFDSKIKKVEVPQLVEHMYHESHKKSKRGSRSRDSDRDRCKGKKKYKNKNYRIEPHRSKPKRRKERVSVTAYFKRTPKPEESCLRMLHEHDEYAARDHRMGAAPASMHTSAQQFSARDQHSLGGPGPASQHQAFAHQQNHPHPPQGHQRPHGHGQGVHQVHHEQGQQLAHGQSHQLPHGQGHQLPHGQGHQLPTGQAHGFPPQGPIMLGAIGSRMAQSGQQQIMQQPQNNPGDVQRGPGGIRIPQPPPHMQQAQQMNQDGHLSVPAKQGKLHVETSGKKPKVYPVSPRSSLNSLSDDDGWSDSDSGTSTPVSSVGSDYGRGRNGARRHSRSRSRSRPEHFGVPRRHHSKPLNQRPIIVIPQKTAPPPPPPPPLSGGLADAYDPNPRRSDTRTDDFDESPRGVRRRETLAPRILQGVSRFSVEKPTENTFENDVEYLEDGLRRMKVDGSRFGVRGREYPREDLFHSRLDDRYDDDSRRPSPRRWDDREAEDCMRSRERRDDLEPENPFAPRRGGTYQTSMYR